MAGCVVNADLAAMAVCIWIYRARQAMLARPSRIRGYDTEESFAHADGEHLWNMK
jgi:hypothetical protein